MRLGEEVLAPGAMGFCHYGHQRQPLLVLTPSVRTFHQLHVSLPPFLSLLPSTPTWLNERREGWVLESAGTRTRQIAVGPGRWIRQVGVDRVVADESAAYWPRSKGLTPRQFLHVVRRRIQHSRLERDDSNALVALENEGIRGEVDKAMRWLKAQMVAVERLKRT